MLICVGMDCGESYIRVYIRHHSRPRYLREFSSPSLVSWGSHTHTLPSHPYWSRHRTSRSCSFYCERLLRCWTSEAIELLIKKNRTRVYYRWEMRNWQLIQEKMNCAAPLLIEARVNGVTYCLDNPWDVFSVTMCRGMSSGTSLSHRHNIQAACRQADYSQ